MEVNASNLRNALIVLKEEDPNLAHLLDPLIDDRVTLRQFADILKTVYETGYNRPSLSSFTVTGSKHIGFPMDMLRKGDCWPATTDDANLIEKLIERNDGYIARLPKNVTIRLTTCASEYAQDNAAARWASFGWTVATLEQDAA
ncbi:hypothetical protein HOU03_gp373 [Caulobacter phage CcrSC]|uniref:Uncharacterized protein n=1 Tax=Caulobacter phage CcrSC TaxID=2283272 RepID=A0A385EFS0_9CAUD|nr:hypothetical protein HOU03_gp373 [Caulobacter phage CcrSC]AXQ69895.1 hypothetical protein CcrSC_gp313 [Caulobacter phage CcrSC]